MSAQTVNLSDFDHTIYQGDCTFDFFWYCAARQPLLLAYLPYQTLHAVLFLLKLEDRTAFKARFSVYLRQVKDVAAAAEAFWASRPGRIKSWYRDRDHSKDVIISASPEFLLAPIAKQLGALALIATRMDPKTGRITGLNNRGPEKVRRFRELFPDAAVQEAYSDHASDQPILELAQKAFIVQGDRLTPWRPTKS